MMDEDFLLTVNSASVTAFLRIPSTKLLLDTEDYFFDAVPIAIWYVPPLLCFNSPLFTFTH